MQASIKNDFGFLNHDFWVSNWLMFLSNIMANMVVWGPGQSAPVGGIPAHDRGLELDDLKVPSTTSYSMILW